MQEISCAFTGHRPKKFPWGYDEVDARCVALKQVLTREIVKLIAPAFLVELAKVFSVSTDYLLGVERLESLNVTGLAERDVAMLSELADRLRHCSKD